MIVKSENDAAAALARDHSGSIAAFAAEMNCLAHEIGAEDSYFVNPHGLPASQYSTARDMAIIAYHAYREPIMRRLMATKYYTFLYADGRAKQLENTNKLLGRSMICNGMKTGFTNAAGRCLVSSATNGSRDVILVQLGSKTSYIFDDAETMMQWGLNSGSPSPRVLLADEFPQILGVEPLQGGIGIDRAFEEFAFFLLHAQHALLDGVAGDELDRRHDVLLPDAVRAVGGLRLDRGIPPRVKVDHRVCRREVESHAARFQAD